MIDLVASPDVPALRSKNHSVTNVGQRQGLLLGAFDDAISVEEDIFSKR